MLENIVYKISTAQKKNYVALPVQELNKIEEEKEIDSFYQLDYNKATITMFKDGTATLFPGSGRGEGILFYDLNTMQKMVKEKIFPVKGEGSFWEKEGERVLYLNKNILYYCSKVSAFLGFEVKLSNDKNYLDELTIAIKKRLSDQKIESEEYSYLAIYIGELIRLKNNGKWAHFPEYTLNVYYIPEIIVGSNYCDPIWHVTRRLEEASYISLDVNVIINEIDLAPYGNRSYFEIRE